MTKQEKKGKGVYLKFALIMLVCMVGGGIFGYAAASEIANLPWLGKQFNGLLRELGLWWYAPGYGMLILANLYYLQGKKLLPAAEAEDEAFETVDRKLSLSMLFAGAATPWMLIAPSMSFTAFGGEENISSLRYLLASVGLMIVYMIWLVALQARTIGAIKRIYPEKRGNVFDTKFQKDWYQSCDEAERQQIGQCSYQAFKMTSGAFSLAMLVVCLLALFQLVSPGYILLVGVLWLVQQLTYSVAAYRMNHKKDRVALN